MPGQNLTREEAAARAWGREWAGAQSAQTGQAGPGAGR